MIELWVYRKGEVLIPASASDRMEIARLPQMKMGTAAIHMRPSKKLPRWYRAMVQLLTEATGRWPNRELAHKELMVRSGFFESFVINGSGDARITPMSTAEWDAVQWRAYLDVCIPLILREYVGGTRAEFRDRVDAFLGIKLREAWEE